MYLDKKIIKEKYKIFSFESCDKYCRQTHKRTSVIISITSFPNMPKVQKSNKNNVQDILYLEFADCSVEDSSTACISWEDAQKIVDFVNKWYGKVDTIIVNCDGGVSRSAGVCAAIMRVKEGDDWPIFDNNAKHPNMTCYHRVLTKFNYDIDE